MQVSGQKAERCPVLFAGWNGEKESAGEAPSYIRMLTLMKHEAIPGRAQTRWNTPRCLQAILQHCQL